MQIDALLLNISYYFNARCVAKPKLQKRRRQQRNAAQEEMMLSFH
jgi:hypothetical protein